MIGRRSLVMLCATVTVALGMAGCATNEGGAAAQLPPLPPGADQPFDLFLRDDLNLVEKADLKLFLGCLSNAGYPQEQSVSTGGYPAFTSLAEKPLAPRTEAQARKYGFGAPVPPRPAEIVRKDPAFFAAASRCERTARGSLGGAEEFEAVRQRYLDLGNSLVKERADRVRTILEESGKGLGDCLAGKGYPLRPGEKFDARGKIEQFGVERGTQARPAPARTVRPKGLPADVEVRPAFPARGYRPSPAETKLAVAFVACGRSVGVFGRVDDPALQQEIVQGHAAEFADLNPRLQRLAEKAAAVLMD